MIKLTTFLWYNENTICYQLYVNGIYVSRRHDNNMINGTKLLNLVGMSRGKRDGILKNEKEKIVIKIAKIHLKGVWITFSSAKSLAIKHGIEQILYPIFEDNPSMFLISQINCKCCECDKYFEENKLLYYQ